MMRILALLHTVRQNTQLHNPTEGNVAMIHDITNVFTLISTISVLGLYPKDILAKIRSDLYNMLFTTALFEPEKDWEQHKDSSNKEIIEESMTYPHSGTPCSHKEEWERSCISKLDLPPRYTTKLNKQGADRSIECATFRIRMHGKERIEIRLL